MKYKIDAICLISTNGFSIGLAPDHVRIQKIVIKIQNIIWLKIWNLNPLIL